VSGAAAAGAKRLDATRWITAVTEQLLARHGLVTREALGTEQIPGGFSTIYPVLKLMEEGGRLRRGYFVTGLGAAQFALPGAVDRLRSLRDRTEDPEVAVLSATDPANPYGATLPWPGTRAWQDPPESTDENRAGSPPRLAGRGPTRTAGATVVLVDGVLTAYLAKGDRQLLSFLPEDEPDRSKAARAVARALNERARAPGDEGPRGMLIEEIDGGLPRAHPLAPHLADAGFIGGALGFQPDFRR
jgi:ATP-dependent Lhr-like helicase